MSAGARTGSRLAARIAEREAVLTEFLDEHAEALARACHALARSFARGGVLVPFGTGAAATDAAHVAVEFMHPVIVGKRALPALAPTNDPTGQADLPRLGRPDDIALALSHGAPDARTRAFLEVARTRGLLTLAMTGRDPGGVRTADVDFLFRVDADDPTVVQEIQETTYHVLWELVHVFFEHPGLLADACITCGDVAVEARVLEVEDGAAVVEAGGGRERVATDLLGEPVVPGDVLLCHAGVALERLDRPAPAAPDDHADDDPTAFLYPFLDRAEDDLDAVLADVRASTLRKGADVVELRRAIDVGALEACAARIRPRLERGGRLIAFGNGGSSTDAQDLAADALAAGWSALALTNDVATITAVANDVGFDKAFARQLIPLARPDDVAVAISTSGSSPNVVAGLEEAHRRGLLTVGVTGTGGGRVAELPWLDALFVVPSDYVPRLQEAHATMYHLLVETLGRRP